MIANTLLMPTEKPINLRDIKRALLSFDQVYIPSPDDRELIPPISFMAASSSIPIPFGMNNGPVRPLGKIPNFDDITQRVLDDAHIAIKEENVVIMQAPAYHEGAVIGNIPLPANSPNPKFVYQVYRSLASYPDFMTAISRGLDSLPPLAETEFDELAPFGQDDGGSEVYVNGVKQTSLPNALQYNGFAFSEAERVTLTRLCRAKLGATVKNLAVCHLKQCHPYTSDPGVASVIQMLTRNMNTVIENANDDLDKIAFANRLRIIHDIVLAEYIDPEIFDELTIKDILKMRTKAWGKAREARTALAEQLKLFSIEYQDIDDLKKACKKAMDEYIKAQGDLEHEWTKFRIKLISDVGSVTTATGLGLIQKTIPFGTLEAILAAGTLFYINTKEKIPEIMDLIKANKEIQETLGYALFRPYLPFK